MTNRPKYIVVHTSASRRRNVDVSVIDRWHRDRGWSGVGYHYVILDSNRDRKSDDGRIQVGRLETQVGAHCRGLNQSSIGVCLVGDHDWRMPTDRQLVSLAMLLWSVCERWSIEPDRIIGHRDVNALVESGLVPDRFRTDKTCPGRYVKLDPMRDAVRHMQALASVSPARR